MARCMRPRRRPVTPAAAVAFLAVVPACGYRLAATDRTVRVALAAEGPLHPEALPAVQQALSERLRDEGLRLVAGEAAAELAVVVRHAGETPTLPAEDETGHFAPAAWDVRLTARAMLRRGSGAPEDLGVFETSAAEAAGASAAVDDRAHTSAFALAARSLAARLVAALLSRW